MDPLIVPWLIYARVTDLSRRSTFYSVASVGRERLAMSRRSCGRPEARFMRMRSSSPTTGTMSVRGCSDRNGSPPALRTSLVVHPQARGALAGQATVRGAC